ncbi:putative arabinogalactan peptide, AGP [Medicago truncatula]|uniref:Arabinogalactan peptide-like protein n=1 Tax=Medicago truncatula TaxID=3880 RepID=A0A072VG86_MEDTR|nr:arabinogalactan protein 41 [Medicago truncatula]KEH40423.1 arabinogalactan peptide-like protein [Medicago truncatula]RHN77835.1 putative arabinogalactan peptide, AGP [Medicago truncatula]
MTLSFWVVVFLGLIYASFASMASSQYVAPAPAPAPTSDGTSIDQAIAYVLMLVALLLTYIIH